MQRARVPGMIGLLIGGFLIGPHGLGLIDAGNTTVPDLGQLGLLYLMFVAGVELDLGAARALPALGASRSGSLTFAFPMAVGTIAGFALGWAPAGGAAARLAARLAHAGPLPARSATPGWPPTRPWRARSARPC